MATIYTHQSSNIWKTWLLMGGFFVVLIGIGWFVSYVWNSPIILIIAVVLSIVMNIASYWYSDKLVLSLYRAVPATAEGNRELWKVVENLSITAGLPMPKVYIISDLAPNAFATGRNKEHAALAVTTGLLAILNRNELEGVVAHELSHVGNRDILISTVTVVLVGCISIMSDIFLRSTFLRRRGDDDRGSPLILAVGIIFIVLAPIAGVLMQLAISRKREYLADASGVLLTRYPEGLASALEKIGAYKAPVAHVNSATAHLFISNPFGSVGKGISRLFMTHPPIEDRIRILRDMAQ